VEERGRGFSGMPIYEYRCNDCGRLSSFLLLRATEALEPYCKSCGSKKVSRVLSRIVVPRSEERRVEGLFNPARFSDLDENDPRSIERLVKKIGSELGDELGEDLGQSMEEALEGGATGAAEEAL
jgi:putative FmdB family regulatory protein